MRVPKDQVHKYRLASGSASSEGYALVYNAGKEKDLLLEEVRNCCLV